MGRNARSAVFAALAAVLAFSASAKSTASGAPLGVIDEHRRAIRAFGNDAPWYEGRIPFFEASDRQIEDIYYYRWSVFRAHQRDLGPRGYISTEFLDDVSWQREPYASLNDATGFHIAEGRWLRDRRYTGDYIDFMYEGGGNDRHFSEAIADATFGRFLADGDEVDALRHLGAMRRIYDLWDDHYDTAKGLYWIEPLLDATEYTISSIDASRGKDGFTGGEAFRPTINSYMFANARAISRLSALAGDRAGASLYAQRAEALRTRVQADLWSSGLSHFVDRYKVDNASVHYWEPIRGRELAGYVPWAFELPADSAVAAEAWRHLLRRDELGGAAGMRTTEPTYRYYMRQYRYDKETGGRECQWNGPAWPFQMTQALAGMANLLHDYHQQVVTRSDYMRLLRQYALLHYQNGRPDLEEDYDPDTGKLIVGLPRSHHYNHSGYVDLIVTGLVGVRPREDDVLEVDPLASSRPSDPGYLRYFALQDLPYHGHLVSVRFDADGSRYGHGAGLALLVDGRVVAHADTIRRLSVSLRRRPDPPVSRTVDRAVNLVRGDFPRPSASINPDPEQLHQAIDGRVWFFPEVVRGWSTSGGQGREQWLAIDFGRQTALRRAELSFFGDGRSTTPPDTYRVQIWRADRWVDVGQAPQPKAVENGTTVVSWPEQTASKLRVLVRDAPGRATRLVELKAF